MKKLILLSLFLILLSSFVVSQNDGPSTLVGEYFLDADKSISVMDRTVGIGNVRSNGEVYVYINSYGRWIYPKDGFIEFEGLIVEPIETFYDSTDPNGHSASIVVYSTITEEIREPDQIDEDSWLFDVDEEVELFDKKIKLLDVYDDGTVVVQVGKPTVIVFSGRSDLVYDGDIRSGASFIEIANEESYYTAIKSERAAQLGISQGFAIAGSEPAPVETINEPSDEEPEELPAQKPEAPEVIQEPVIRCDGCLDAKDNCIPIGVRIGNEYCGVDKELKNQFEKERSCNNNFECDSNVCVNNQCIGRGFLERILAWFSRLFD
tara:strand:- start:1196 stop:2158 length:963 start_codon:yes stop_codon:yes gene_type:complete